MDPTSNCSLFIRSPEDVLFSGGHQGSLSDIQSPEHRRRERFSGREKYYAPSGAPTDEQSISLQTCPDGCPPGVSGEGEADEQELTAIFMKKPEQAFITTPTSPFKLSEKIVKVPGHPSYECFRPSPLQKCWSNVFSSQQEEGTSSMTQHVQFVDTQCSNVFTLLPKTEQETVSMIPFLKNWLTGLVGTDERGLPGLNLGDFEFDAFNGVNGEVFSKKPKGEGCSEVCLHICSPLVRKKILTALIENLRVPVLPLPSLPTQAKHLPLDARVNRMFYRWRTEIANSIVAEKEARSERVSHSPFVSHESAVVWACWQRVLHLHSAMETETLGQLNVALLSELNFIDYVGEICFPLRKEVQVHVAKLNLAPSEVSSTT